MARVEARRPQLRSVIRRDPTSAHELQRLGDVVGEFLVAMSLRTILHEAHVPLVHALEVGIAARREGTDQVQRRRRLPIGLKLAGRIGNARFGRELRPIDDVTTIARQFLAVSLLGRRRTRLCELPGNAADFGYRLAACIGQDHRHLQEDAEEVADVVGAVLGEAFGAVAALEQKTGAPGDSRELLLELTRFARENQRREGRETGLDIVQRFGVRIIRHLHDRFATPAFRRPFLGLGVRRHRKLLKSSYWTHALRRRLALLCGILSRGAYR